MQQAASADDHVAWTEHCRAAIASISRSKEPLVWAHLQGELGTRLHVFHEQLGPGSLDSAVRHLELALKVITRDAHPKMWANLQHMLAGTYLLKPSGDESINVETGIRHYKLSLSEFSEESDASIWAATHHNLARAFDERTSGSKSDNLEQAIFHCNQAMRVRDKMRNAAPKLWAMTHESLGIAYRDRHKGDKAENIEVAISHFNSSLMGYPRRVWPSDWGWIHFHLASAYQARVYGDKRENLDKASSAAREAIDALSGTQDQLRWAEAQHRLADIMMDRIDGNLAEHIDAAVEGYEAALKVFSTAADPTKAATTRYNLGNACRRRLTGKPDENAQAAIGHYEEALKVLRREVVPEIWANVQSSLGAAYRSCQLGARDQNLELAIRYHSLAQEVFRRDNHPELWARSQVDLGNVYLERLCGERAKNIDEAIEKFQGALSVVSRVNDPWLWANANNSLGTAFWQRISGERAENIERAIDHLQRALEVYSEESSPHRWASTHVNLATTYADREVGEQAENAALAIAHSEHALRVLTREGAPLQWATCQFNLANAYVMRHMITTERSDLDNAIACLQRSLEVYSQRDTPYDWAMAQRNLCNFYVALSEKDPNQPLIVGLRCARNAAIVFSRSKFPFDWAMTHVQAGNVFKSAYRLGRTRAAARSAAHFEACLEVLTPDTFPHQHQLVQTELGHLRFEAGEMERAHQAYDAAIQTGELLLAEAYTDVGRRAAVDETSRLYAHDAYCQARLGRIAQGLLKLEQGKTRLLSEALALTAVDVSGLSEERRDALMKARSVVHELNAETLMPPNTPARRSQRTLAELLRGARKQLGMALEAIRRERPDFMPSSLGLDGLLSLIPADGALVAPLTTSRGSAVFVIPGGRKDVYDNDIVWLDGFDETDVHALLDGSARASTPGGWFPAYANRHTNRIAWLKAVEDITQALWDQLMAEVHAKLSTLGLREGAPVLLMPQGGLGALPLHAAWRTANGKKRYFLDDYTVTQVPSGHALSISHFRLKDARRHRRSLLAVIDPTVDLPFAAAEGDALEALFTPDCRRLDGEKASGTAVMGAVTGRAYLHFSCHGFYAWRDPMLSGLVLARGERLTLADVVARLDLSASRLATLSACETGLTDVRRAPDEYLGLPAGFLRAGAPAVVSTLWEVNDLSTMLVMERFYRHHLDNALAPDVALRQAQRWLRDVTQAELGDFFERYRGTAPDRPRMPLGVAEEWLIRFKRGDPAAQPFRHPYHWAAFVFSGI